MPFSMRPTITCKKCNGSGVVPMPPELERTLRSVIAGNGTTEALYRFDRDRATITRPAINARLNDLQAEGLVIRRKGPGKYFIYTATAKARRLTPTKKAKETSGSAKTTQR